jgi:hypothetical protein
LLSLSLIKKLLLLASAHAQSNLRLSIQIDLEVRALAVRLGVAGAVYASDIPFNFMQVYIVMARSTNYAHLHFLGEAGQNVQIFAF